MRTAEKQTTSSLAAMSPNIGALFEHYQKSRNGPFAVSVEKGRLITESYIETEGEPAVVRNAKAIENILDNIAVFLEPNEIIAGNLASKVNGVELTCLFGTWPDSELDALCRDGFMIEDADRKTIAWMNEYWKPRAFTSNTTRLYDDERLWPYAQLGVVLPAFKSRNEGWGAGGQVGPGYGVRHEISQIIGVFDFESVLRKGTRSIIAAAQDELNSTHILNADSVHKIAELKAIIIVHEALIRFAHRFADLAERQCTQETDPKRRAELKLMAETCRRVPEEPARTFHEAMQSLWFLILVILPSNVLSFGRLDQVLYPFYRADIDAGRLTDEEALSYLQWLRIKDSQIVITAGQSHRNKYAGFSKWHNCVIGGQTPDGDDATNALSYLILEAARTCPAPHHTITMRVHDGTPAALMDKALALLKTGIGLPAFISDTSCIEFLCAEGIDIKTARNFAIAGCLGLNIPGQSRLVACPMFVAPLVLLFALNDGIDPRSGLRVGPATGHLTRFKTFDELIDALKAQLKHFLTLQAEFNNVTLLAYAEALPQPAENSLTEGSLHSSKNVLGRTLPLENGSGLNPIGMINVVNGLAAIRQLVFEERSVEADDLMQALASNWEGPKAA
jgi:formate C-acetyltransferase